MAPSSKLSSAQDRPTSMSCTVWGQKAEGGLQTLGRLLAERTPQGFQSTQEGLHIDWGSRSELGKASWRRCYRSSIMKNSISERQSHTVEQTRWYKFSQAHQDTRPPPSPHIHAISPHWATHPCASVSPWSLGSSYSAAPPLIILFHACSLHSQGEIFTSYFTEAVSREFLSFLPHTSPNMPAKLTAST